MKLFSRRTPLRASKIDIKPPEPDENRSGLAIVAIVKNEANYIEDWIKFHAFAGITDFIIYDNASTDGTVKILRQFASLNITIIPWNMNLSSAKPKMILPRQILAYCHAVCTFGSNFKWMGFIDVDEFLVPKDSNSIPDLLQKIGPFENLSLPWRMFGHNQHEAQPTEPVPFAYTMAAQNQLGPLLNFKCIVDPCTVTQVSTHKFRTKKLNNQTQNTQGKIVSNKARTGSFVTNEHIQLNHYYLRSKSEMLTKMAGSAVSGTHPDQRKNAIETKAQLIEQDPLRDQSALLFLERVGVTSVEDFHKAAV